MREGVRAFGEKRAPHWQGAVRLATWNVNSLRARLPRVLELLDKHAPDVVLLQETKVAPDQFPADELARPATRPATTAAASGRASRSSRARGSGSARCAAGLPGEIRAEEARWVEADVAGLGLRVASTYVVNGREVGSETFAEKLHFLEMLAARAAELAGTPLVIGGDFNVTPADEDVYDAAAFHARARRTSRPTSARAWRRSSSAARSPTPIASSIPTSSSSPGGTTARVTSIAAWACASTCCSSRGSSPAASATCGIDRDLRKGTEAERPRAAAHGARRWLSLRR